ncbi:MAG: sulfatase-like hydrolase/transferase [bacterium]|nr:sulfatase-like hydrolase/transferase [bacterium]
MRAQWICLLLTVPPLLLSCTGEDAPAPRSLHGAAAGWNVLLISLDTVRSDHLGAYGYTARDTSPQLDALIGSGVRFERAMAPRAATWPSLASVLSGLYPSGHGVIQNGYELPDELATLPKLLQAAGYQTGAFLSNMCRAHHRGWDELTCAGGADGKVNRQALEWAEGLDPSRPFFLWTHYFAAHSPYYNGGDLPQRVLDPDYDGTLRARKKVLDRVMEQQIPLDERDLRHLGAIYDAAVMGSDRIVGRLVERLRASSKLDRTLVVVLADHGEDLYEHHRFLYHACSVYQTGLQVPLALVAPGLLPEGESVAQAVELIDVMPTVLDLLGLKSPSEQHGRSLVPYLAGPGAGDDGRPAFSEYGSTRVRTVLAGHWKLVDNPDHHRPICFPDAPEDLYPIAPVELYDLARDPAETRNLAADHPVEVAALRALIRDRFAGLAERSQRQVVSEELKEELRALGYVTE